MGFGEKQEFPMFMKKIIRIFFQKNWDVKRIIMEGVDFEQWSIWNIIGAEKWI